MPVGPQSISWGGTTEPTSSCTWPWALSSMSRVAGEGLSVHVGGDRPSGGPHLTGTQGQAPHVEELPEGVQLLAGRLDVNDAVGDMSVEPVEAAATRSEGSDRGRGRLDRRRDADGQGDLARLAVDEHRKVGVNVVHDLLGRLALDAVNGLTVVGRVDEAERRSGGDRHPFGSEGRSRQGDR